MTTTNPGWRWPLAVLGACLALTLLLWALRAWVWIGVPPINEQRTPFSDTLTHLSTAVNCADGLGEWHGRACFLPNIDAVPRAQTYEPWLTIHRLGIDQHWQVQVIAVAMVLLFYLVLVLAFRPRGLAESALVLALLFTPAVQLGVERGNFDLMIATLLCLAAFLLADRRVGLALVGVATLSLATMLKLYTGLACLLAGALTPARRSVLLPAGVIGVILAVLVVGPRELVILGQGAPEGATRFSTGARWLLLHAGWAWAVAAPVLAAAVAALFWRGLRLAPRPAFVCRWPRRVLLFQLAALTALPLFLLKDSYDYRLVLWLPCLSLPLALLRAEAGVSRAWRRLAQAVIVAFVFVASVELPASWLDRLAISQELTWARPLAGSLALAKQFAAWLLSALLALIFFAITDVRGLLHRHRS